MTTPKKVLKIYNPGSTHWVGDGFHVRNLFPSNGIGDELSPFLMLDYAGPTRVKPSPNPRGVGEHPHRGFETVTIAYQGAVEHRDSAGHSGTIYPGDVQWMTAASGVVHEEMHEHEFARKGGTFEMIQLWVNLPKAHKMSRPRYQTLAKANIPSVQLGSAGYARVIAGELGGAKGPAQTYTPVNVFDVRLKADNHTELTLPAGQNAAVVLLKGNIIVNSGEQLQGEAKIALLSPEGEHVTFDVKEDSILLILSGEPIHEPVFSYGPFVMNTREEILEAVADYQAGKMGHLEAKVAQ
ncbi:MAG: short-chain dehydrogenase [Acidobacteria bacterium]|nr:MAG: short-chain dehydrogenase [Acidobacteriota bacterium]